MKVNKIVFALTANWIFILVVVWMRGGAGSAVAPTLQELPLADNGWSIPVNLSQSGAAGAPQLLMVNDGYLVLWQDAAGGFAYAAYGQGTWTEPEMVEFPFATRSYFPDLSPESPTPTFTPYLVAGPSLDIPGETIYAFWLDDQSVAGESRLFYSRVTAGNFGYLATWSERQQIAEGVAQMAATVDGMGRLHLVTLQADGLYSYFSADNMNWSDGVLLYASDYYRQLDETTANVQMAADGSALYAAWDDWPRGRVMITRSFDGGQNWLEAEEIDSRLAEDSSSAVDPSLVRVAAQGGKVYLTWQAGHGPAGCAQYYRWSADGGQSWEGEGLQIETAANICPQSAAFLDAENGDPFLFSNEQGGSYLYLWSGGWWSDPQLQVPFSGFIDGETFRQITPNCGQDLAVSLDQLVVVVCGQQDIWLLSRDLGSLREALLVTPVWDTPVPINEMTAEEEPAVTVLSPVLIGGRSGRLHAFWSQALVEEGASLTLAGSGIYYAVWDGERWSQPVLLVTSPGQKAVQPTVALAQNGRLVALWSGGGSGEIYFSWAAETRAAVASEWTVPALLPAPRLAGSTPDLAVDMRSGVIYAVYAVPLNEQRGIYLVTSEDGGESWSEAELVFDGVAAGWDRVDRPRLALGEINQVHLIFEKRSLPDNVFASTLYYTRSSDRGATWSEAKKIENSTLQNGPVVWSDVVAVGEWVVHRAWQERDADGVHLWHQISTDGGATWSGAVRIGGFEERPGAAALISDLVGQVYLLTVGNQETTGDGQVVLEQWQWLVEAERWEALERLELHGAQARFQPEELAAVVTTTETEDGTLASKLAVLFSGQGTNMETSLLFTGRSLVLPEVLPSSPATPTPPRVTPSPTVTPLPEFTATPQFPKEPTGGRFNINFLPVPGGDMLILGGLLALVPAVFVVLLVVAVYARNRPGRN